MSRAAPTTGSNRRTARKSWQLRATPAQDLSPKAWKLSRTFLSLAISASTCSKVTCSLSQWRRANSSGRCSPADTRPSPSGQALSRPRKKYGREVGRIAAFAMPLRMRRGRSCLGFDDTPIEMPRRVAEDRHNDRQAEEQRERSDNKQGSDNKAPQHHRERVAGDRAER